MKDIPKLTIGYATHNRKDYIVRRLNSLITRDLPNNVEVIIVDNASSDGTYETILNLSSKSNVKVYRNDENLGFSGNFVEILKKAKGDYVLWSSDEDEINIDGIYKLFSWIDNKKYDVIFLNHYRQTDQEILLPIRKNKTRMIKHTDLWECCHLPGSIWNRSVTLNNLDDWGDMKEVYPNISRYYPNLLLMIRLLPFLNSYFFNEYITYQKDYAKSQHITKLGYQYCHLIPRWLQHNELIDFIELCSHRSKDAEHKKYFHKMMISLNRNLYVYISSAILKERPDLYVYFSRSCSPFYFIIRNYKRLKSVIKSFFDSPSMTVRTIKIRLKARYGN